MTWIEVALYTVMNTLNSKVLDYPNNETKVFFCSNDATYSTHRILGFYVSFIWALENEQERQRRRQQLRKKQQKNKTGLLLMGIGKRFLIVDSEKDVNLSTKTVLKQSGFKVESYEDPFYAIENFKINSYELVILDIKMPGLNRFQLYLGLNKKDDKVIICFLTGRKVYYGVYRDIFSTVHANCFIRKPVTNEELLERINQIIENDNTLVEASVKMG